MASRATRAQSAASGDVSWCPRPQVQRAEGALDAALEAGGSGEQFLRSVVREGPKGQPELIAEGYAYPVAMSHKVGEPVQTWTERRWVVRSVRQAHAAALRARVAKARAQSAALTQRGRGTKRFETVSAFRQAVVAMGQRSGVAHFCWLRLSPHVTSRARLPGAASSGRTRPPCPRRGVCGCRRVGGSSAPVGMARGGNPSTGGVVVTCTSGAGLS